MYIYNIRLIKIARLFIASLTAILALVFLARVLAYLFDFPVNPIYRQYSDGLLGLFPGYMEGVDFSVVGIDMHGIFGIIFAILVGMALYSIAPKLLRKQPIALISGIVDAWTYTIFFTLAFGFIVDAIELNSGSSVITDFAHQFVVSAASNSSLGQLHLTTLFLMISVVAIGVLLDTLLKLRYPILHTEFVAPELELKDFASIADIDLPSIKFSEHLKAQIQTSIRDLRGEYRMPTKETITQAVIQPWKSWMDFVET